MAEGEGPYQVPQLASFFHRFPHLSITFHQVNSTFDPRSEVYLEALGILASVPAAWLILSLFCLLVYLLTRCCDRNPRRKRSITPLKWSLGLFAIVCCGAVAVGLYGNDDTHNGTVDFISATKQMDDVITSVKNQTATIDQTLQRTVLPLLKLLSEVFERPVDNKTAHKLLLEGMEAMKENASRGVEVVRRLGDRLHAISLYPVYHITQEVETIRWPVTLAVLSLLLLFCVLLLAGLVRHSRCILITFSVFGLFAVILNWLLASIYVATAVALGDLCVAPNPFIESQLNSSMGQDIMEYYLKCRSGTSNPFAQSLHDGEKSVDAVKKTLEMVKKIAEEIYPPQDLHPTVDRIAQAIDSTDTTITGLAAVLDCTSLNKLYNKALYSVCDLGLYGLTFMLLSAAASGLLYTILVWIDSHTWIYIRKKKVHTQEEERDPFLPPSSSMNSRRSQGSYGSTGYRPRHAHTPPPTPPFPGTLNGRLSREEKPYAHSSRDGPPPMLGPNNGQYPTLSKQCKTLESSDFY